MGEKQNQPFQLSFNASLKVDFQGSRVTSDGGLILVRELDERLGFGDLIAQHLTDSRKGNNTQVALADPLRQSVYSRIAGYEDVNDAERLSQDPAFRLIGSEKVWDRGAALTSRLQTFETEMLAYYPGSLALDETNVSGSITLAFPLPAPGDLQISISLGENTILGYDFTDGVSTWDESNSWWVVTPMALRTDISGAVDAWYINLWSPHGGTDMHGNDTGREIGTSGGGCIIMPYCGVQDFAADQWGYPWNQDDPGTWTASGPAGTPEPTTIGLTGLGGAIVLLARRRQQQNHRATRRDRTPPAHH